MVKAVLNKLNRIPISRYPFEIVERKGIGHPDSLCDGAVERAAVELTRYYYENFGYPYHFNIDKAVLVGGRVEVGIGGGKVIEPIILEIVGRATLDVRGKKIPIEKIIRDAVVDYVHENFRYLDPEKHLEIRQSIRPGSADLVGLYERWIKGEEVPLSNDTSIGVGFAPFTDTEKICLTFENYLNSKEVKAKYPAIGEDIKVMCVRKGDVITATVAMATVASEIGSASQYLELKEIVKDLLKKKAKEETDLPVEVRVNTADAPEENLFYLTVTGTSAEAGDDGQVGRGNRANGLITPLRPMSMEAAAGKNPVSHVGKIYQIFAQKAAQKIYEEINAFEEVYVMLVSTIGKPITEPQIASVSFIPRNEDISLNDLSAEIDSILNDVLEEVPNFWKEYMKGYIKVF